MISFKSAPNDLKTTALMTYSGAVAIANASAKETNILDRHVVPLDDEDSLSLRRVDTICNQPGAYPNAPDDQMFLRPNSCIAFVVASIDFDGVAVPCNLGSLCEVCECREWLPPVPLARSLQVCQEALPRSWGEQASRVRALDTARAVSHRNRCVFCMLTLIGSSRGTTHRRQAAASQLDSNKDAQRSASGVALSTLVILGASVTGLAVARDAHRHGLRSVVVDSSDGPGTADAPRPLR